MNESADDGSELLDLDGDVAKRGRGLVADDREDSAPQHGPFGLGASGGGHAEQDGKSERRKKPAHLRVILAQSVPS